MSDYQDKENDIFIKQLNLTRGVLAQRNKRQYTPADKAPNLDSLRAFRIGITRCFLNSRAALKESQFDRYLDWYYLQLEHTFPGYAQAPIGFDHLAGIIESPVVELKRELVWISARLKREVATINSFRAFANQIDSYVLNGEYGLALGTLIQTTALHGESMWSVQLRFGLEQASGGLEAQKKFSEIVRNQYPRRFLSYIGYNTSLRNESRTSLSRFRSQISEQIKKKHTADIQAYLHYRFFAEWPILESEIADVLRIEQSHTIIDIYESLVSLGQEAIKRDELSQLRPDLLKAIQALHEIKDFRLDKIRAYLGDPLPLNKLQKRNTSIATALIKGDLSIAKRSQQVLMQEPDAWSFLYRTFVKANTKLTSAAYLSSKPLMSLLSRLLVRSNSCAKDMEDLEKQFLNLPGLAGISGLYDFLRIHRVTSSEKPFRFFTIGLNSPYVGAEDIGANPLADQVLRAVLAEEELELVNFWRNQSYEREAEPKCLPELSAFAEALKHMRHEDTEKSIAALEPHLYVAHPLRHAITTLLAHALAEAGKRERIIDLIADEVSNNPSINVFLPIEKSLKHLEYRDYKRPTPSLAPLIALNSLLEKTEDDRVASILRFAMGQLLRSLGDIRPSTLASYKPEFSIRHLIHFLRYVCIPTILDAPRIFKNSTEMLIERREICSVLTSINSVNKGEYEEEFISITYYLKVMEGLKLIDRNRVHVDVDAISRWAHRTISDEFARYKDLDTLKNSAADPDIGTTLRDFMNADKNAKQLFFTPESEADTALIALIKRIREEFLNNASYGLDYFLSKRIRHQSFIGLLRGPLEFSNLITTRATEYGEYSDNEYWLKKFTTLDSQAREGVSQAFKMFAEDFDNLVSLTKDKSLQIRSTEYPEGIFDIVLSDRLLLLAKTLARGDLVLEDFLQTVYMLFWSSLENSLENARKIIDGEIKVKIDGQINSLKNNIRFYTLQDPAFNEFSAALSQASGKVQTSLNEAVSWFQRPEVKSVSLRFTLEEALNIAIESAKKLNRSLNLDVAIETAGEIELVGASLVFITDVVMNTFSNIRKYSGISDNKVKISLKANIINGLLTLEAINKCSPRSRTPEKEERLQEIRDLIARGAFGSRTKREGLSGFLKIAATVAQSPKGVLEFGYLNDNEFRVCVSYNLIIEKMSEEKNAA